MRKKSKVTCIFFTFEGDDCLPSKVVMFTFHSSFVCQTKLVVSITVINHDIILKYYVRVQFETFFMEYFISVTDFARATS